MRHPRHWNSCRGDAGNLNDLGSRLVADGVSPDCLAAGILAFFEQEWSQELTPERLHRFVQQNYSWEKHVLAVEAVYEAMLEEAKANLTSSR